METNDTDRRASGVKRVDYSTLVEICGREPGTPAFEAEAVELSGRGMLVRTRFLPELHAPLVLRFEHDGKEAVVEGEVAWRHETNNGGEFGIKFTALDSNGVRVLREACSAGSDPKKAKAAKALESAEAQQDDNAKGTGTPVRLHIQGLGAPMKARVFESSSKRLRVGSQLEFLKVGRALELEDVDGGDKRAAEIDSVSVTIDPATQIPQLVVSLRYGNTEQDDSTPEPSVVGDDGKRERIETQHRPSSANTQARSSSDDQDEDFEESADLFKGRVAVWAGSAGEAMRGTSAKVAQAASGAALGLGSLLASLRRKSSEGARDVKGVRRTTKAPSSVAVSARGVQRTSVKERARTQRPVRGKEPAPTTPPWRKPKVWALAAAAVVCVSGAYPLFFASRGNAPISSAPAEALPPRAALPVPMPASAAVAAAPVPLAPGAFPAGAVLDTNAQGQAAAVVTANVPLFGNQQLATLEPAPLTPPPGAAVDELSMAKDLTFAQPVLPALAKNAVVNDDSEAPSVAADNAPSGDAVWQAGRMHLPVVHRLRLDGAGTALQGTKTPSGFSVLVPGRKVMETGSSIAKRDDRIVSVNVKNTPAGGQVIFRFRKDVPGYKVRLRNDYVEFFINSPE